jgi:hypothetical protein
MFVFSAVASDIFFCYAKRLHSRIYLLLSNLYTFIFFSVW